LAQADISDWIDETTRKLEIFKGDDALQTERPPCGGPSEMQ